MGSELEYLEIVFGAVDFEAEVRLVGGGEHPLFLGRDKCERRDYGSRASLAGDNPAKGDAVRILPRNRRLAIAR
ncbi:hypothetical protein ULG90_07410 [Halopseudomonas pachastrellae]|nr:hypothetical protein ULG90_07410 [Halopseudomonas pachastrellae]